MGALAEFDYEPCSYQADYELQSYFKSLREGKSRYTVEEVAKHRSKDDCWVIVNGLVLDVTDWLPVHPGGHQAIILFAGMDASTEWNQIHPPDVISRHARHTVIGQVCSTDFGEPPFEVK